MSEPFLGEIRAFGFNFPPRGWSTCSGQLLPISQNSALFSLLGTYYGGDGRTTFGLPDLRGRSPMNQGQGPGLSNRVIGQPGGAENFTLNSTQMPQHSHTAALHAKHALGSKPRPGGNVLGISSPDKNFISPTEPGTDVTMADSSVQVGTAGASQPVFNQSPYLVVNFCIALVGIFPSRS